MPPEAIRRETTSRSTRESLLAVSPILAAEKVRTVALVTSPYHQRRAFLAARRAWPDVAVQNRPADPSTWRPDGWWRSGRARSAVLSEYGKLAYYAAGGRL